MEEDDIAAAMGFSSFGGPKKRKYGQANSPPPPSAAASSSGANSTRLGSRPKISNDEAASAQQNSAGDAGAHVVESTEAVPGPIVNAKGNPRQPAATSLADFLNRGHVLPDKPPGTAEPSKPNAVEAEPPVMVSFGGEPITKAELNALRQGVRNDQGDLAYFLPSFVEDPWEKLARNRR